MKNRNWLILMAVLLTTLGGVMTRGVFTMASNNRTFNSQKHQWVAICVTTTDHTTTDLHISASSFSSRSRFQPEIDLEQNGQRWCTRNRAVDTYLDSSHGGRFDLVVTGARLSRVELWYAVHDGSNTRITSSLFLSVGSEWWITIQVPSSVPNLPVVTPESITVIQPPVTFTGSTEAPSIVPR